ncbi:MAG: 30S ribosomal protein S20, partial [Muribaculaceae bacterium]|nr:30S ribosomal protein S20 [Muribaculaceae bacterium]
AEANRAFSALTALLDERARKNTISKNKAANLKSALQKHINSLAA